MAKKPVPHLCFVRACDPRQYPALTTPGRGSLRHCQPSSYLGLSLSGCRGYPLANIRFVPLAPVAIAARNRFKIGSDMGSLNGWQVVPGKSVQAIKGKKQPQKGQQR